jgi:hypothetical protein
MCNYKWANDLNQPARVVGGAPKTGVSLALGSAGERRAGVRIVAFRPSCLTKSSPAATDEKCEGSQNDV